MSTKKINNTLQLLQNTQENGVTNALKLTELPQVKDKFVNFYNLTTGSNNGELVYHAEKLNFVNMVNSNDKLKICNPISLYKAFLNAALNRLSFDPLKNQVYLIPHGSSCNLFITPYGEAQLRIQSGQFSGYDAPVVVYNCDDYSEEYINGDLVVNYKAHKPRPKDAAIIGTFIKIYRTNGSYFFVTFDIADIEKWRSYSKSPNSKAWQDLPAMAKAKTIKHAFKKQPNIKPVESIVLGEGVQVEEEQPPKFEYFDEEETTETPQKTTGNEETNSETW